MGKTLILFAKNSLNMPYKSDEQTIKSFQACLFQGIDFAAFLLCIIYFSGMKNRELLQAKFTHNIKDIQKMLKRYRYNQQLDHSQNMEVLSRCLQSVLDDEELQSFQKSLCNEDQVPIQINFKQISQKFRAMRLDQLLELYEAWFPTRQNTSSIFQRMQQVRFRNILFKTLFLDEKAIIDEFFQTLSPEKKIKSFDLYQLITNLLNRYYLYEYNTDSITFFDKIDSFQAFIQVVDNYFLTNHNFLIPRSKNKVEKYIHRQEFQLLIEHWESINHQLVLLERPRRMKQNYGAQTIKSSSQISVQVQTDRTDQSSMLQFVNSMLHNINTRLASESNPQILISLSRIQETIRKQKLVVAENKCHRRHDYKIVLLSQNEQKQQKLTTSTRVTALSNNQPIHPSSEFENIAKEIYTYLSSKTEFLNSNELQIFFYHLGLAKLHETYLLQNLERNGFIEDPEQISFWQFKTLIKQILKQSKWLQILHLKQYIKQHIGGKQRREKQSERRKLFFQKGEDSQFQRIFQKASNKNLSKRKNLSRDDYSF